MQHFVGLLFSDLFGVMLTTILSVPLAVHSVSEALTTQHKEKGKVTQIKNKEMMVNNMAKNPGASSQSKELRYI